MLTTHEQSREDTVALMADIGRRARAAARPLAIASTERKNAALTAMAEAVLRNQQAILDANAIDISNGEEAGLSPAMMDRLKLTPDRIRAMADGIREIAALNDPVGEVIAAWDRPNGLHIERVRTPLGVIGVIYESRPNVTADAGALCLKAGNAVILRGGSDSLNSSGAIHACLVEGLKAAGLPEDAIQLVPTTDRAAVGEMLAGLGGNLDVIIPRGGKSLVGARAGRGARAGLRASRRHLPSLCRPVGQARHGGRDRRQRQDAPHRHLRFGRDAAGRPRGRRHASGADPRSAARGRLRNPRHRRSGRRRCCRPLCRPPRTTGRPNISTRSFR